MAEYDMAVLNGELLVRARFERRFIENTNFRWKVGFVLYTANGDRRLRWGIWDGGTPKDWRYEKDAIPYVEALLEKGYYLAETVFPPLDGYTEGSFAVLVPPDYIEKVILDEPSVQVLTAHLSVLRKEVEA